MFIVGGFMSQPTYTYANQVYGSNNLYVSGYGSVYFSGDSFSGNVYGNFSYGSIYGNFHENFSGNLYYGGYGIGGQGNIYGTIYYNGAAYNFSDHFYFGSSAYGSYGSSAYYGGGYHIAH